MSILKNLVVFVCYPNYNFKNQVGGVVFISIGCFTVDSCLLDVVCKLNCIRHLEVAIIFILVGMWVGHMVLV